MFLSGLEKRLNDTSISKKLYFTIGFTALLVTIELCTLWFSVTTLSAVRSYVGGEGLWSKAQKDAILNLREYAYSHKEEDYLAFQEFLKVPYGDKAARIELQKAKPDFELARKHLLQGRNHPDDIDGMMKLLRRFSKVYYLNKAFTAWAAAEPALEELIGIAGKLHDLVDANGSKAEIDTLLVQIDKINAHLTKLEDNFSLTLGEGARWLEGLVLRLVLALSLTIGITSILIAVSINRSLKKSVDAIIKGAELIRGGSLKTRVPVYSKDEIGMIAVAFNEMTNTVENNVNARHQFLVDMSHEMRTPMNAVLGFAGHLKDSSMDTDQRESVQMIIESGEHLLVTLNGALRKIEQSDGIGQEAVPPPSPGYQNKHPASVLVAKELRILVVEDNLINQRLVLKLLDKQGHVAAVAENGQIALDKLEAEDFDLVLMDLQMPVMDGYEATRRIRALNSEKAKIPIIAMTAHTVQGDKERCLEIGINEYISKPYHAAELYDSINRLVVQQF
ncbi:MAG: response regulator [Bacteroidota bacterium]